MQAPLLAQAREVVSRTVAGMGFDLVELERAPGGLLRVTLEVAADGPGSEPPRRVGIDDCERVSRQLGHVLPVEGVEFERLEVSSPGLDRPLRGARDFTRFAGELVKIELLAPRDGRKRFQGRLAGLAGAEPGSERVRLTLVASVPARKRGARGPVLVDGETIEFALAEVAKARLAPEWEFVAT